MKIFQFLLLFLLTVSTACFAVETVNKTDTLKKTVTFSYIIGPGDILDISVWKDESMSKLVTVLPDGRISFPLIGDVIAEGKTVTALKIELNKKIGKYIPSPNLSLAVQQINSMLIYIIGRVNHPGRFILNSNINVLQALAMAGGLNPFAKENKIVIFRKKNGKNITFNFRYKDVIRGENFEQNIIMKRGDIIVIP